MHKRGHDGMVQCPLPLFSTAFCSAYPPAPGAAAGRGDVSCSTGSRKTWRDRLAVVLRKFERAADIGTPTDAWRGVARERGRRHAGGRVPGSARRKQDAERWP